MAERVDKMPVSRKPRTTRYPWDEWFDGSVWELTQGKDFECRIPTMYNQVRGAASTRRIPVRIAIRGDRVYVQAER